MENRGGSSCAHMEQVQQRAERIQQSICLTENRSVKMQSRRDGKASGEPFDRNAEDRMTREKEDREIKNSLGSKRGKNTAAGRSGKRDKNTADGRSGKSEKNKKKAAKSDSGRNAGRRNLNKQNRNRKREVRRKKRRFLCAAALVLAGVFAVRTEWKQRGLEASSGNWSLVQEWKEIERMIPWKGKDAGEAIWQDELILVNKDHKLPDGYEVRLHWLKNGSCAVSEQMYGALQAMLTDGSDQGYEFIVASGYRDSQTQQALLDEDIGRAMEMGLTWQEAYDQETLETMPPGYSEHETGLAVDIVSVGYQILDRGQVQTPENQWLRENCSSYGFILRYPEDKEAVTKINYEPWHFRYVGEKAAKEIMERGITLEEYLDEQKSGRSAAV